jgi:MipA family protein
LVPAGYSWTAVSARITRAAGNWFLRPIDRANPVVEIFGLLNLDPFDHMATTQHQQNVQDGNVGPAVARHVDAERPRAATRSWWSMRSLGHSPLNWVSQKLNRPARLACLAALATLCAAPAASIAGDEPQAPISGPLLITLGSNAVFAPRFEGSSRHDIGPWPIISWRHQGDKEWLDQPTDGLDYALIETDNFRMGPVGFFRWQRDNATILPRGFNRVGKGHSQIDLSLEGGLFAEYWPVEWLRTRLEVRESLLGASGLIAIAATDVVWHPTAAWTLSLGPRLTLGDHRYMESYYGVNAAQAATSGLSPYRADAGIRSYGVAGLARYKISESWTTQVFFDYQHLTGSAGDSPVIANRGTPEQYLLGAGLSYTFKSPWQ